MKAASAAVRELLHGGDELDDTLAVAGVGHVFERDAGNALGVDFVRVDPGVGREGGQDGDLPAGVDALDVSGGVLLGIALLLGDLEGLFEGEILVDHRGQDEVGGAVEDAVDGLDLVAGEAEDQGPDERDAAADAGFKEVVDVVFLGDLQQFQTAGGHEFLVGRDHVLAGRQTLRGEVEGGVHAAHGLGDDPDGVIVQDVVEILREFPLVRVAGKVPEVQDIFDFEVCLGSPFVDIGVFGVDDFDHAGTDGAIAHDSNVHSAFLPSLKILFRNKVHK